MYIEDMELSVYRRKRRRRRARRLIALFLMPILFSVTTVFLLYVMFESVMAPYTSAAMLLIGDEPYDGNPQSKDLLSAASPQTGATIDWTPIDNLTNSDDPGVSDETVYIKASEITMPHPGDLYANITISGTSVDAPVYWGDSERELNKGVGTYTGGWLPGWGRTVMLAGHRNTDFADLRSVEIGAVISVVTHYGTYTYEVVGIEVYNMRDSDAYDFLRDEENIVLYTCYPFNNIGAAVYRVFVYGEPLTGTPVARYS